jgi:hypothetical protein
MASCCYSAFIGHGADRVWAAIRRSDAYEWVGEDVSREHGAPAEAASDGNSFIVGDRLRWRRLLDHSDADRCCTYAYCEPAPVRDLRTTLRVAPCVKRDGALVEYSASFDCPAEDRAKWMTALSESFARSVASLRLLLDRKAEPPSGATPAERPAASPDLEALWQWRVAEDRRHWEPRASDGAAPAAAQPDLERLWKTIQDAVRGS